MLKNPLHAVKDPDAPLDLMLADCLGCFVAKWVPNPLFLFRTRSDEIIRCLEGRPSPSPSVRNNRSRVSQWTGTYNVDLSTQRISSVWLSNFSDSVIAYYEVDGVVISSPVRRKFGKEASEEYDKEIKSWGMTRAAELSLSEQKKNWLRIDDILSKRCPDLRKVGLFYDASRIPNVRKGILLQRSEAAMRSVLSPLGWEFYAVPFGSPVREDGKNYWAHYDTTFSSELTRRWVLERIPGGE